MYVMQLFISPKKSIMLIALFGLRLRARREQIKLAQLYSVVTEIYFHIPAQDKIGINLFLPYF